MLKNDIEKTLQAHRPAIPAGFSERSDAQVLQLFAEGKKQGSSLKRKLTVLVCGLLLMLTLSTALAATVPGVNDLLYKLWPQAADALMPVNAGCEDQGIRMDVISAVAKDEQILVTYTMQDLEGDRIDQYTEAAMYIDSPSEDDMTNWSSASTLMMGYDVAEKKATFSQNLNYTYMSNHPDEQPIRLYVPRLHKNEVTNLYPLLEQYGKTAEATALPENVYIDHAEWGTLDGNPESLQILDASRGPDLALNDDVLLTGIGWIDGKLHVQVHLLNYQLVNNGNGGLSYAYPYNTFITVLTPAKYDFPDGRGIAKGFVSISWDGDNNGEPDWFEYIFDCDPEELKLASFAMLYSRPEWTIEGKWEVTVPYRMIKFE